MSQDTGMREGDRPAGTEDLLNRPTGHQVHPAEPEADQRLDDDRMLDEGPHGPRHHPRAEDDPALHHAGAEHRPVHEQLFDDQHRQEPFRDEPQHHLAGQPVPGREQFTDDQLRNGEQLPDDPRNLGLPIAGEHQPTVAGDHDRLMALFDTGQVEHFRGRWLELQAAFVDEPRSAVQRADQLVAEVMQTLAATFARNKQELEGQWQREGSADTETLRQALRRYRSFFDQLLRT